MGGEPPRPGTNLSPLGSNELLRNHMYVPRHASHQVYKHRFHRLLVLSSPSPRQFRQFQSMTRKRGPFWRCRTSKRTGSVYTRSAPQYRQQCRSKTSGLHEHTPSHANHRRRRGFGGCWLVSQSWVVGRTGQGIGFRRGWICAAFS